MLFWVCRLWVDTHWESFGLMWKTQERQPHWSILGQVVITWSSPVGYDHGMQNIHGRHGPIPVILFPENGALSRLPKMSSLTHTKNVCILTCEGPGASRIASNLKVLQEFSVYLLDTVQYLNQGGLTQVRVRVHLETLLTSFSQVHFSLSQASNMPPGKEEKAVY